MIINYLLPCLVFNKVLSSIDASDLKSIGVMLLTAWIYQAVGLAFSILIKAFFPTPKYWFGGLIVAGIFTNSSDLPIAYITTFSSGTLFTQADTNKGVAYCVLFLAIFIFSMFNLGSFRLVQRDFTHKAIDIKNGKFDPDFVSPPLLHNIFTAISNKVGRSETKEYTSTSETADVERTVSTLHVTNESQTDHGLSDQMSAISAPTPLHRDIPAVAETPEISRVFTNSSHLSARSSLLRLRPTTSKIAKKTIPGLGTVKDDGESENETDEEPEENLADVIDAYNFHGIEPTPSRMSVKSDEERQFENLDSVNLNTTSNNNLEKVTSNTSHQSTHRQKSKFKKSLTAYNKKFHKFVVRYHLTVPVEFFKNFRQTPSVALIVSIIFTMIPQVRRLFYLDAEAPSHGIPDAPDGGPILGFVMDFTTFVGNATVPFGLFLLGATLARLKFGKLPKGFAKSIVVMGIFKLVVLPIIAVAWTKFMIRLNWISQNNHMAIFVMIISSGVPTATSQVYLTAMYMPREADMTEMDCLAAFLIFQYSFLLITMTILLTYTLKNLLML